MDGYFVYYVIVKYIVVLSGSPYCIAIMNQVTYTLTTSLFIGLQGEG